MARKLWSPCSTNPYTEARLAHGGHQKRHAGGVFESITVCCVDSNWQGVTRPISPCVPLLWRSNWQGKKANRVSLLGCRYGKETLLCPQAGYNGLFSEDYCSSERSNVMFSSELNKEMRHCWAFCNKPKRGLWKLPKHHSAMSTRFYWLPRSSTSD